MELADRVVVVTGGGSGIGEALCHAAHAEKARHIVVADLDGTAAERVATAIGPTATGVAVDVSDEAAIQHLVATTEDAHGPIDLFVSNAGFVTAGGVEDSNEAINKMWDVHCMAHIYAARAVLPSMIARGEGYLLNTASAAGLLSQIGSMTYSVTKAAAVALADWLAITHHHQGVRVSVLCPQAVRTNIIANSPDQLGSPDTNGDDFFDTGVASVDGVLTADQVAADCIDAIRNERFLVLPHPQVQGYAEAKANDRDRWLAGMRKYQAMLHAGGPLPGDAIAPTP